MSGEIKEPFVTSNGDSPLELIEFRASWCAVCSEQSLIVERIAREYRGRLRLRRLEIDGNTGLALEMGVLSVPTLVLCLRGREIRRLIGLQDEATLRGAVQAHLERTEHLPR